MGQMKTRKEVEWQKFLYIFTFYAFLWLYQNNSSKFMQKKTIDLKNERKKEAFIGWNRSF